MADQICALFCVPPIAIARLGGSSMPMDAFEWHSPRNPRSDGETVIVPAWTLDILSDGRPQPRKPAEIVFRDGDLIRPVCPFIEIWARVGEPGASPDSWRDAPLTEALLADHKASLADLTFTVTARNLKVARRSGRPQHAFGTFPALIVRGDDHEEKPVLGRSPPGVAEPMIPEDRHVPLGSVRVLQSWPQPPAGSADWVGEVDVEVVRMRYTPAAGLFYGPPPAAIPTDPGLPVPAVEQANAFLNPDAGWLGSTRDATGVMNPPDTIDELRPRSRTALGVVDDTCELRIDLLLATAPGQLATHANIFVAPPDFAPDRRPFLSVADELNDRAADADDRNAAMQREDLDFWVADLFERVYEHVSLMNVDYWRGLRGMPLPGPALAPTAIDGDSVEPVDRAMGGRDRLRNRTLQVGPAVAEDPLPLSGHARERHRTLSDADFLRKLVLENPNRLRELIRGAFEVEPGEDGYLTSMRMPPFMRHSNALPLTLSAWQYDLVMRWVGEVLAEPGPGVLAAPGLRAVRPSALAAAADSYRAEVLARLDAAASE